MGRTFARAHRSQPWRIHELTRDFRLEDVWSLPTPGGPDDFDQVIELMQNFEGDRGRSSLLPRLLVAVRWKLGEWFGWDDDEPGEGVVRGRLPADLAATVGDAPAMAGSSMVALYRLDREYAAEIVNKTVDAVVHLGWVPGGDGGYRTQMAVLVKPNGTWGRIYMAFIKPFRYAIVYPALLRGIERAWQHRMPAAASAVESDTPFAPAPRVLEGV